MRAESGNAEVGKELSFDMEVSQQKSDIHVHLFRIPGPHRLISPCDVMETRIKSSLWSSSEDL